MILYEYMESQLDASNRRANMHNGCPHFLFSFFEAKGKLNVHEMLTQNSIHVKQSRGKLIVKSL